MADSVSLSSALILSVDWTAPTRLVASASDGQLACVAAAESSFVTDRTWKAHELEVWCSATNQHNVRRPILGNGLS